MATYTPRDGLRGAQWAERWAGWLLGHLGLACVLGALWAVPVAAQVDVGPTGPTILYGTSTPEAAVTGSVGDKFIQTDGAACTTMWHKESGSATNTGWKAGLTSGCVVGVSGQVAVFSGTSSLGGDTDLTFTTATLRATNLDVRTTTATDGYVALNPGGAAVAGYVSIYSGAGTPLRLGYLGFNNTDLAIGLENSADLVIIGGDVGIGIAAPTETLHLYDSVTHAGLLIDGVATGSPYIQFQQAGSAKAYIQYVDANDTVTYYNTGGHTFTGNVGIADASPAALFTVGASDLFQVSTTGHLSSNDYASRATGWKITEPGNADFRYLFADELHVEQFVADLVRASYGIEIWAKSVSLLGATFTCPDYSNTSDMWIEDLPSMPDTPAFESGDWVNARNFSRVRPGVVTTLDVTDCIGTVASYADGTGANEGLQYWLFTRSSAAHGGAMAATTTVAVETVVLDYGISPAGYFEINAVDGDDAENAPYAQVVTWVTSPAVANRTVAARYGNLSGYGDYSITSCGGARCYGMALGPPGGDHLDVDPTNGIRFRNSTTTLGQLTSSTWTLGETGASKSNVYITAGAVSLRDNTTARINLTAGGVLTVNDSGGNAVITLDAATGAQITKTLTLDGATSALSAGVYNATASLSYPTDCAVGTGIWMDRTEFCSTAASVTQVKIDAVTGALTAGAGAVTLAVGGITIARAASASWVPVNALQFVGSTLMDNGDLLVGVNEFNAGGVDSRTMVLINSTTGAGNATGITLFTSNASGDSGIYIGYRAGEPDNPDSIVSILGELTTTGNVGVGTPTASARLDVEGGELLVSDGTTTDIGSFVFQSTSVTSGMYMGLFYNTHTTSAHGLWIATPNVNDANLIYLEDDGAGGGDDGGDTCILRPNDGSLTESCSSSRVRKTKIKDVPSGRARAILNQFRVREYAMIGDASETPRIGVIAEEIPADYRTVITHPQTGEQTLGASAPNAWVLIAAINELQAENAALASRLATLEKKP